MVKVYGPLYALDSISFEVIRGGIFGVLGPNGAGKTTLLETMVGMRQPTSGSVIICGFDPISQHSEMSRHVSIQPQHGSLFDHLTVQETLQMFASFYPDPIPVIDVLRQVDLEPKRDSLVKRLSGGQRQRLLVGVALIANTDVLFLDEPTGSLDPQARRHLWDVIRARRDAGKTVVLTTHSMEEAHALCDRLTIIHKGKSLAMGSVTELINRYLPEQLIVYESSVRPETAKLEQLPGVVNVRVSPSGAHFEVRVRTHQADETLRKLLFTEKLVRPGAFRMEQGTLEDVFLALVNEERGAS